MDKSKSPELTKNIVNKVFLAKRLKIIGFSKKGIFVNLLKNGSFNELFFPHENELADIMREIEIKLKNFVKENRKVIIKQELLSSEEKAKKEMNKIRSEIQKLEEPEKIEEVNSDQELDSLVKVDVTKKSDSSTKEESKEISNDESSDELEYLKQQLKEKDEEIEKLKKLNFSLNKKLKNCTCC